MQLALISSKRLWYDLPDIIFFIVQIVILLPFLWPGFLRLEGWIRITLLISLIVISGNLLNRRFGWWIKNYTHIGMIDFEKDGIKIEINSNTSVVKFENVQQIFIETQGYQNYSYPGFTESGIGLLRIFPFQADTIECNFLVTSKQELEQILELKNELEKSGKLRLYK